MRRVRVFNEDVLERFMLGVALSQAAHSHDGVDLLGEGATPAMGFRLGGKGASMTSCLLSRNNLTRLSSGSLSE
jgi:hypothetical protein